MKKRKLLIYLTLLISIAVGQSSIKVLTYNLMGMKPDTDWETRLYHTIQHIKEIDPDIIGVQEMNSIGGDHMGHMIVDSLEATFGINYYFYDAVTHTSWGQFDESVGIISKYPVIASNHLELTAGIFPRVVVWNLISTPIGMVNLFSTHLSFRDDHNHIRVQQVEEILEYVNVKESSYPNVGSIVVGDFNCTPNSEPISLVMTPSSGIAYKDSYKVINPNSNGYTYPTGGLYKKIDYIFVKDNSYLNIEDSELVMNNPYDGQHYPSDHCVALTEISPSGETLGITSKNIPDSFKISDPFPNPFNHLTNIIIQNASPGYIQYSLVDIMGRNLINESIIIGSGTQSLQLNMENISSGTYFLYLRNEETIKKAAVTLVK